MTSIPSNFVGTDGYYRRNREEAMEIIRRTGGESTYFITVTTNPHWPEFSELLEEGQDAFDRPDITCRVFNQRLHKILHWIHTSNVLGTNVLHCVHVIEFQKRGLPHAHIVVRYEHGYPETTHQIDQIIQKL